MPFLNYLKVVKIERFKNGKGLFSVMPQENNSNYIGPSQFMNLVTKIVSGIKPNYPTANPGVSILPARGTSQQLEEVVARLQKHRGKKDELYETSFMALCHYCGCEINETPTTTLEGIKTIEKDVVGTMYDAGKNVISINPVLLYLWEEAVSSGNKDIAMPAISSLKVCLDASLAVAEVYSKSKPKQALEKLTEEIKKVSDGKDATQLMERNKQLVHILNDSQYRRLAEQLVQDQFVEENAEPYQTDDYSEIFKIAMESPQIGKVYREIMKMYIDANKEYHNKRNFKELGAFLSENIHPLLKMAEFVMNGNVPLYERISNPKTKNNDAATLKSIYLALNNMFVGVNRNKAVYSNHLLKVTDFAYASNADIKNILKIR